MDSLNRLRKERRVRNLGTWSLVLAGPALAVATILALGPLSLGSSSNSLRFILLSDMIYVLLVAAMVLQRVARMIAARRAKSAGSRLHMRLTGVFTFIALVPTVTVAMFATVSLNFGLEGWFSDRVRQVVGNSLEAAQAYEQEHREGLTRDAQAFARFLNTNKNQNPFLRAGELREILSQGQTQIQRGLREAFIIDGNAVLIARGERSYLFDFETPAAEDLQKASEGETTIIVDWSNDEYRALIKLTAFADRYLYISRNVDGAILSLLDETKETIALYNQLEEDRSRLLFEFGLIYLGFAILIILAAIWLGLWFAERLSRPVGRLAGAAQRVGAGNLDTRVAEEQGDDEIAMLSRVFNQMTRQLKGQRDSLVESNIQTEESRRLFDSVLTGVTTGVISLNSKGKIDLINHASQKLLDLDGNIVIGSALKDVVPEFAYLFHELTEGPGNVAQQEVQLTRAGSGENLLVRIASRQADSGELEGYVVTFDDVTDLITAQRMAAWGDVARRIAHEIKNPLTPIQLSADRLRRKFSKVEGIDQEALEQYTSVIIRQTEDLRRIVDEFSKFARMPEPERRQNDLVKLIKDSVFLQESAQPDVKISLDCELDQLWGLFDATMISQSLTNLIKNAGEAIESYEEKYNDKAYSPEIRLHVSHDDQTAEITIMDNGVGLPENRARLFEPYVTNREKGTGLGLSIVKKIIEEHGGTLELLDAEIFEGNEHFGACARIKLPGTQLTRPKSGQRNVT